MCSLVSTHHSPTDVGSVLKLAMASNRTLPQGRIQDFPKGGVETHDTKCEEGEGGAVRFRLDTNYEKRGVGLLSGRGGGTLYEMGVATPKPPPPPPPPPCIRLCPYSCDC